MDSKIAWKGELILAAATWADNAGHKAKFKIVGGSEGPNPFKYFTKRRKGRAGTRFKAAFSLVLDAHPLDNGEDTGRMVQVKPLECELMLANWTDSSSGGHTVEFWCDPPEEGMHIFEGFERGKDSFMVALVELDDDDSVIDQKKRAVVEEAEKSPQRRSQRLSQVAAMMCQNEEFQRYVCEKLGRKFNGRDPGMPMYATNWMREELCIESRAELDRDSCAAQRFHERIRKPFLTWNEHHPEEGLRH